MTLTDPLHLQFYTRESNMDLSESKTAHQRPSKSFFLHIVFDQTILEWTLIHSSMPLANGGGQVIATKYTKEEVHSIALRIKSDDDEILIHEDVRMGNYSPAINSCLVLF